MNITVLVPAHNEEGGIAATLESLMAQTRRPDEIVVVADNCTDRTAEIARSLGATVLTTVDNRHKKAGALNQALAGILPAAAEEDAILVMDADSELNLDWIAAAVARLEDGYDACGGTFTGRKGGGFVGMLQRNEYARYLRDVARKKGKTLVLTGTATLFRVASLRKVVEARRSGRLPGEPFVYDVRVLTEDNELTLAFLHLGLRIIAPAECHLTTDVMTSWGDLHRQRLRWKRGALENLIDYKLTRQTLPYWGRQIMSALGLFVTATYLLSLTLTFVLSGHLQVHPLWLLVTATFMAEQAITVRGRGWKMAVLAVVLVVEMPYDLFLQATHARALVQAVTRAERRW